MSIKITSQVWELDLPATDKLVLLGFADHANDDGICRPSFARIAWKCGISKATVKRTVRRFQTPGILTKIDEARGPGYPAAWRIRASKGVMLTPFISDLERSKSVEKPLDPEVIAAGNGGHERCERGSSAPGMGVTAVTSESKTGIEDWNRKPNHQRKRMTIRFSAAPDWDAIERRTEEVRADANSELRAEGYEAHLVDAGLQFILERVDFSGAVPASSQYFVTAFHGAMADDRDRKKIEKRAARRAAIMKQSEIELRTTAVELERVAKDSGLPIKRLIERRAEGGHR